MTSHRAFTPIPPKGFFKKIVKKNKTIYQIRRKEIQNEYPKLIHSATMLPMGRHDAFFPDPSQMCMLEMITEFKPIAKNPIHRGMPK